MSWARVREYLSMGLTGLGVALALWPPSAPVRVVRIPGAPSDRRPLSGGSSGERVAAAAMHELDYHQQIEKLGPAEETALRDDKIVSYWEDLGIGRNRAMSHVKDGVPWSGAFVQAVVNAGASGTLERSGAHSIYGAKAREYALRRPAHVAYLAYPAHAVREPAVGDIVLKPRQGEERSFADLATVNSQGSFGSHGDVIVEVSDGYVIAVGGNKIRGKVTTEKYMREADGSLAPPVFAVLRLSDGPTVKYYADASRLGFRRARPHEVTSSMRTDAQEALGRLVLGEEELVFDEQTGREYLLAAETHSNAPRGISVFVPSGGEA